MIIGNLRFINFKEQSEVNSGQYCYLSISFKLIEYIWVLNYIKISQIMSANVCVTGNKRCINVNEFYQSADDIKNYNVTVIESSENFVDIKSKMPYFRNI